MNLTKTAEPKTKKIRIDDIGASEDVPYVLTDNKNISEPIKSLKEALKYKFLPTNVRKHHVSTKDLFVVSNSENECHQELNLHYPRQRIDRHAVPKTLVCHDMKGGYLEDKYINGCDIGNGYTFYRWANIDIFIYFSHHFVTIPPVVWINVAHRNNVKILGTLITEWTPGEIICDEIFESEKTWRDFAKALVNICILHSFDGWLINIENKIKDTESLIKFISYLTDEMHKVNSEYLVLWYDSVTQNGELKWQNELNDLNKCYFDICDGIFLNYTWKEENLINSVVKAEHRLLDVFVGVDVFGRNCYGGGGFNTHAAAEMVRKHGLSMALFAQGWTHETLTSTSEEEFYDAYCRRDNAFWLNLYPYLYTHPIVNYFTTTFYLGSDKKSYNLEKQELVLTRPVHCGKENEFNNKIIEKCDCIQIHNEGCKPNTISYLITKPELEEQKEYVHKLFSCSINATKNIVIATVSKQINGQKNSFDVILITRDMAGKCYRFRLLAENQNEESNKTHIFPLLDNTVAFTTVKQQIRFEDIGNDWTMRFYFFPIPSFMKILEIGAVLNKGSILLGGFAVHADLNINI